MTYSRRNRPSRAQLFELSSEQGGYFTAAEAQTCGYSRALLAHHAKSGQFIRVRQGLYRFRDYPSSPREDVIAAWLATGREAAVVSHESALDILGSFRRGAGGCSSYCPEMIKALPYCVSGNSCPHDNATHWQVGHRRP